MIINTYILTFDTMDYKGYTNIAICYLTSEIPEIPKGWKAVQSPHLGQMTLYAYLDRKNKRTFFFFFDSNWSEIWDISESILDLKIADYSCVFSDGTVSELGLRRYHKIKDRHLKEYGENGALQHHECAPGFTIQEMVDFSFRRFLPQVYYREKLATFLFGFAPMLRTGNMPILPLLEIFQNTHPEVEQVLSYHLQWQIAIKVQKTLV